MEIVIVIAIVICLVLIVFLKMQQNDSTIKKDSVEFDTEKSVSQITDAIRSFNCEIERLKDDPLDNGPAPAIAILMYGEPKFTDKFKHIGGAVSVWGVQVIVNDLGERRHVELVALGHNQFGNSQSNKGYGMGFSREYRDKIAQMLA